jgi:hypothetical protein
LFRHSEFPSTPLCYFLQEFVGRYVGFEKSWIP